MEKKAVISQRIFMQIYTFTSTAVKVEPEQKFVSLAWYPNGSSYF